MTISWLAVYNGCMQKQIQSHAQTFSEAQGLFISEQHIVATPDVRGGKPRIAGRRITVADIALWHLHQNWPIDDIVMEFGLTHAEVYAALAYYYDHRAELDQNEADEIADVEALKQQCPSKLQAKLAGRG